MCGGIPAFDNASFTESEDFGDLIQNDYDRSSHIRECCQEATNFNSNIATGNRTNLLFIESSLALIKSN